MKEKTAPKNTRRSTFHWIDTSNLHMLKVKSRGFVGGCLRIPFVVTEDGEYYLLRR